MYTFCCYFCSICFFFKGIDIFCQRQMPISIKHSISPYLTLCCYKNIGYFLIFLNPCFDKRIMMQLLNIIAAIAQ